MFCIEWVLCRMCSLFNLFSFSIERDLNRMRSVTFFGASEYSPHHMSHHHMYMSHHHSPTVLGYLTTATTAIFVGVVGTSLIWNFNAGTSGFRQRV